jgi:hypothetical protein
MSKAVSYYDWELSFKEKSEKNQVLKRNNTNSLGISDSYFKDFMQKWKEKNSKK